MLICQKKLKIIKHKNVLLHIKISKEILTFLNIEIGKNNFFHNKAPIF